MKHISLFTKDEDRSLYTELRKRIDRYGSFKFWKHMFNVWILGFLVVQITITMADMFGHFFIQAFPHMTIQEGIDLGLTVNLIVAMGSGLIAAVHTQIIRLKRQVRDRDDAKFLTDTYNSGRIMELYTHATKRLQSVGDLKVVADGLDEAELGLIQKAVRGSGVFAQFEHEVTESWRVFLKTTNILRVQPLGGPTIG